MTECTGWVSPSPPPDPARSRWRALGRRWRPGPDANHHFDARAWRQHRRRVTAQDHLQGQDPQAVLATLSDRPLVDIILTGGAGNADAQFRRSLLAQIYPDWELSGVGQGETDDPRLTAGPVALARMRGIWCAVVENGYLLAKDALLRAVAAAQTFPQARLIYGDEDRIDASGKRSDPWFKPALNPEMMLGCNLMSGLCLIRRDLLSQLAGAEPLNRFHMHDLALRCLERLPPDAVVHVPRPLCHRRSDHAADPQALEHSHRAVAAHLQRRGLVARTEPQPELAAVRVHFAPPIDRPLISVLIPTRNGRSLLEPCMQSLLERTGYENIEYLIADNGSDDQATLDYLAAIARQHANVTVLRCDYPFNYPRLNNDMAAQARGTFLVLMNNDIEVISPGWAEEMLSLAALPWTGCVGARLHYPDGRIQHAGVVVGTGYGADHIPALLPATSAGHHGRARLLQRVSANTGAVLMLRRAVFEAVGGLDAAELAVAWNDIDLCLKVQEQGLANLWTPHAVFVHHEGGSRGRDDTPEKKALFLRETTVMARRWGLPDHADPFYNPNLARVYPGFALANPPGNLAPRLGVWPPAVGHQTLERRSAIP